MGKRRKHYNLKPYLLVVLLIIGALILLEVTNTTHLFHKSSKVSQTSSSSGQNTQPVPSGTPSTPTPHNLPTNSTTNNSGGVVDQKGQTSGSLPPASQWTTSASGNITLQQPTTGSVINSGDTLNGLAKVNNVRFILSDDSVGLIAQGDLSVVNGKFSGTLTFKPHFKTGKLEVFYPNPNNGSEQDVININVSFNI